MGARRVATMIHGGGDNPKRVILAAAWAGAASHRMMITWQSSAETGPTRADPTGCKSERVGLVCALLVLVLTRIALEARRVGLLLAISTTRDVDSRSVPLESTRVSPFSLFHLVKPRLSSFSPCVVDHAAAPLVHHKIVSWACFACVDLGLVAAAAERVTRIDVDSGVGERRRTNWNERSTADETTTTDRQQHGTSGAWCSCSG